MLCSEALFLSVDQIVSIIISRSWIWIRCKSLFLDASNALNHLLYIVIGDAASLRWLHQGAGASHIDDLCWALQVLCNWDCGGICCRLSLYHAVVVVLLDSMRVWIHADARWFLLGDLGRSLFQVQLAGRHFAPHSICIVGEDVRLVWLLAGFNLWKFNHSTIHILTGRYFRLFDQIQLVMGCLLLKSSMA